MKQIKKKLLNLDTSNDDVIDTIRKAMKDASTEDQFAIQQLMEMRSQISSAMTNILRSLYEASQNIISNMR
jgi:vacuolar-type H+-ATPase subunit E/Vma4